MSPTRQPTGRSRSLRFDDVLSGEAGRPPSRAIVVATFLAVLELCRLAALRLYQSLNERGVPQGPIHLRGCEEDGMGWRERIADVM